MNFTSCHAQEDEVKDTRIPDPTALYLGQKPPGLTPELFAPEIFAETGYSEHVYNIIPGEMACVFDRYAEYGFPQGEIFITKFVNDSGPSRNYSRFSKTMISFFCRPFHRMAIDGFSRLIQYRFPRVSRVKFLCFSSRKLTMDGANPII